jgi:hypothetical protein
MKTPRRIGAWLVSGSLAAIAAVFLLGAILASGAREVVVISPHDDDIVLLNQLTWAEGEDVPDIYGIPIGSVKVIGADESRIVIPREKPSLALLKVDKRAGENPFQLKTAWFFVRLIAFLGALGAVTGVCLLLAGPPRQV